VASSLDRQELRGRAWNAGGGRGISVLDLVRTLIRVSGHDVEPDVRGEGTPHGEIDRQVLDSSAIREELGWEPRVDLETGLRRTWEWYARHLAAAREQAPAPG
jgi:nucleoside-diphosphate-sugar epimerase